MKLRIVYDGHCPFCDDYVRYQRLRAAGMEVELIDGRERRDAMVELGVTGAQLEDGMVVFVDGERHDGGDAVHVLARLSEPSPRWWVRAVAGISRSPRVARGIYPFLKFGRRIALRILGVSRFPH